MIKDVYAQCTSFRDCLDSIGNPAGLSGRFSEGNLVGEFVSAILPAILSIAGFISVIMIVVSGIQFISSSGNPEAAAAARGRLTFALIGFAVIILAFIILQIINRVFLGTDVVPGKV